ncbi:MAG: leucine-rich repeat protein [Coriobacteriia bacterium]|nr:leucine-rich repeat protein [Coriobacteriia bacterium]
MRVAKAGASLLLAGALGLCCAGAAVAVQPGAAHAATSKVTTSVKTSVTNKSKITFSFTGKLQSVYVNGHKVAPKVKWNAKRTGGTFTYAFKYQKKHVFKVKVKGCSAKKITRTYDKTKPTATFTKYGSTVVVGSTITAKDKSGIRSITANGTRVRNGYQIKKGGTYTFKVTDKAGNVRTAKVTVKSPIWKTRSVSGGVEVAGTSTRILAAYIPSTVDGKKVVAVGAKAFRGKQYLQKVVVPEGVKSIDANAFDDCVRLTSVTLPSSLTTLDKNAFFYCTRLTSIKLPSRLKTIGSGAFYGTALKTVTIPNSVTSLGKYAFSACKDLTSVTVGTGITKIPARCFKYDQRLKTCKLPDGITEIGNRAFSQCMDLRDLHLTSALQTVGECAFANCSSFNKVTLYAQNIGERAFEGCMNITTMKLVGKNVSVGKGAFTCMTADNVYLGAGVTDFSAVSVMSDGEIKAYTVSATSKRFFAKDGVLYSADGKTLVSYPRARDGQSFTVPASVTAIGDHAFDCANLNTLRFAEGSQLTKVGAYAFAQLSMEDGSLVLPASVKTVGERAFSEVRAKTVDLSATAITELPAYAFEGASLSSLSLQGTGITSIGDYAFERLSGVAELRLPATLQSVGKGFVCGSSVKRFALSEPGALCVEDGVLYSADKTELVSYPAGSNECSPEIPDTVVRIAPYAFYGTKGMVVPLLPDGLQEIGDYAFVPQRTDNASNVFYRVGDAVTSVGKGAFGNSLRNGRMGKQVGVALISKNPVVKEYALAVENDVAYATGTPRLSLQTCNLNVGETQKVRVVNAPEGFRFFSSDPSVCTVDAHTGQITAVGWGRTAVVAAMGYYYLRCTVEVGEGDEGENLDGSDWTSVDEGVKGYQTVSEYSLKSWEKKYYAGNSSVSFASKDNPAINCYTAEQYTAMKSALDPVGYQSSSVQREYGSDLEEYLVIAADLKMELLRHDLPVSTVLYSGTGVVTPYTGAGGSLAEMEASVGQVRKNLCMTSTSLDHGTALSFSGGGTGTVMRILADAHSTPGGYVRKMSEVSGEYELLLSHDVSYQVVDYGVCWVNSKDIFGKKIQGYERYLVLKTVGVEK